MQKCIAYKKTALLIRESYESLTACLNCLEKRLLGFEQTVGLSPLRGYIVGSRHHSAVLPCQMEHRDGVSVFQGVAGRLDHNKLTA